MISIILCTYNRASLLAKTIRSILDCAVSNINYELLIVDNNSTDNTKDVILSFNDNHVRYIFEPNQGLSNARNRGIKESQGNMLIFTDDDVIVDRNWIKSIYNCFIQHPDCIAVGGRILPDFTDVKVPKWIKDNYREFPGPIVSHDYGEDCFEYPERMYFVGANMAFRREVFDKYGLFNPNLGFNAKDNIMIPGEETDIFKRIKAGGDKILYCGKALVYHPVPQDRCNLNYIIRWHIGGGRGYAREDMNEYKRKFLGIPLWLYRKIFLNFGKLFINLFSKRKFTYLRILSVNLGQAIEYRKKLWRK